MAYYACTAPTVAEQRMSESRFLSPSRHSRCLFAELPCQSPSKSRQSVSRLLTRQRFLAILTLANTCTLSCKTNQPASQPANNSLIYPKSGTRHSRCAGLITVSVTHNLYHSAPPSVSRICMPVLAPFIPRCCSMRLQATCPIQ